MAKRTRDTANYSPCSSPLDIFGKACEIKEAQHVQKRMIKEAKGKKSQDSLEIISKMICFKPTLASRQDQNSLPGVKHSSVAHALVTPFLERLRDPDVASSIIRKVKECLNRLAIGFSNNSSTNYDQLLPFVFATVKPFIHGSIKSRGGEDTDVENSDDEVDAPMQVSKSNKTNPGDDSVKSTKKDALQAVAVATWTPSSLGSSESQKSALKKKEEQTKALHKVTDGAAAPKLTGSSRHTPLKSGKTKTLNNPANSCAVLFGLNLLSSSLKRLKLDVSDNELCAMADPFLPLLTHCVHFSSDNQVVILSLRCLGVLLRADLPSVPDSARDLGQSILDHLAATVAASNNQEDLVQGCFKTLTLLISHQKFSTSANQNVTASFDDATTNISGTLPLTTDQMQVLLFLLHSAVREYNHHNSTFGLVKAILSKRYMSTELYDLMDIILELSVQSLKTPVRLVRI